METAAAVARWWPGLGAAGAHMGGVDSESGGRTVPRGREGRPQPPVRCSRSGGSAPRGREGRPHPPVLEIWRMEGCSGGGIDLGRHSNLQSSVTFSWSSSGFHPCFLLFLSAVGHAGHGPRIRRLHLPDTCTSQFRIVDYHLSFLDLLVI
jgi:hypothetical protein